MRMPDPLSGREILTSPLRIQRFCQECEDELQRQPQQASREVGRNLAQANPLRSTPHGPGTTIHFNHAGLLIQRQPNPNVGVATAKDRREFIQDTIGFFNKSAAFFGNPSVKMDRAIFDRVITSSYSAVVRQEQTIDADLGGDADLKRQLRAAYIVAIRSLMTRAAVALRKTENDLYRENSGRIPMWAWQVPHHAEPGITTPIAAGRTVNQRGNVTFATNGFDVTIAPDRVVPVLPAPAKTEHAIDSGEVRFWNQRTGQQLITRFNPPARPTVQIQTTFRRGVTAASPSGSGRGTTAEDVAGGAVTPQSTTLGFHEGTHGLDMVEFLEHNPPPRFGGTVGMTRAAFKDEITKWKQAWTAYANAMTAFSLKRGDCVGTTIDQFNIARAGRGVRVVLQCGP
jgi:hypothetical protein